MKILKVDSFLIETSGYGHNKITIGVHNNDVHALTHEDEYLSHTTDNTQLTDRIKHAEDGDEDAAKARLEAVKLVLSRNGVEYDEVFIDDIYC